MRLPVSRCAALLLLASCAGGDTQSAASADSLAAAAPPPTVTIIARDFAFEAPDTVAGGMTTLRLVNEGPDLHHVQLIKIGDGKSYEDFTTAMGEMKPGTAPPSWIHDVAGPNSPVPGGEQSITLALEPGNYAMVCFIDTPDRVPHIMKGMTRPLVVTPAPATAAAAPVADVNIVMSDYAWEITPALTAGKHMIKLTNTAPQSHEMFIAQLAPGKTVADFMKWAETYEGPPPATPMGGISAMPGGAEVYLPVDLPAGEYVLLCFIPDKTDGQPHIAHGMMKAITIS
ncbi:MAG: hypothetical protein ABIZ91_12140 [Gemmatimonadaceae bacterium]